MVTERLFHDFSFIILVFAFYAFCGWILEAAFRSIKQKQFVNPGLLKGPFIPLYGLFALIVVLVDYSSLIDSWGKSFLFFVFLSTLIEYVSGKFLENFFHIQLWNYKNVPLNYKGWIALPFSFIWGCLGLGFKYYLYPYTEAIFIQIPLSVKFILAVVFITYFFIDLISSTILLHQFDISFGLINRISGHFGTPNLRLAQLYFKRLLSTYPKLHHTLTESFYFIQERQMKFEQFKKGSLEKIRQIK